ncbi:MAG: hypothetical protein HYT64_02205 [Candidatus Yanofskybacteria bacterium]|nr:hypothetical protein [Candidatus Yanofskybacteria bacterium]
MNRDLLENGYSIKNTQESDNYQRYIELGGIINKKDYNKAVEKAANMTTADKIAAAQVKVMSDFAGIELHDIDDTTDPRIILYGILRNDVRPEGVEYHHSQMSDQRIFVEALKMLGDVESLKKMIKMHPHISFKYQRGTGE